MERHANYALVGAISMAILVAAMIFVVWLGQSEFDRHFDQYRIIFVGPVRGLSEGGDVQFNGIKVGQIEQIALDEHDPNRVLVDVRVKAGTPVRVDSIATTEGQGISGINIIQIDAGSAGHPLLRAYSHDARPVIRTRPNALSALLQGGGQILQKTTEALDRVNRLLSDRTLDDLSAAVADLRLTTHEAAANRAMFARASSALAKLDAAATDIQSAAASVHVIADGDGRRAFADISSAASELKLTIRDARGTLTRLDTQSGELGTTTLPNINATMISIQEAADSLGRLVREVRSDPRATLGKKGGKELEVHQ